jgi:hypothetical protein
MKRKDVISFVRELMNVDDEDPKKQSGFILHEYKKADKKTKEAIDNVFIVLCGYSLESVMTEPYNYFSWSIR